MKQKLPKDPQFKVSKDHFIGFLASSTPEEINRYIQEKGKPRKLICPIYFHDKKSKNPKEEN